ncbi:MAG: hypothetical protein ACPG6P_14050, partial [Akkermansiaceae bacterium]
MKFPFSTTQSLCLLGAATILGACAPYPPAPNPHPPQPPIGPEQPSTTDEATRQMEENRRRMRQQEEDRRRADRGDEDRGDVAPPRPVKKKYPTAVHVPGREGFVFNPYTNN